MKFIIAAAVSLISVAALAQTTPSKLYTVQEGYKVDGETMKGFRTWRAAACDRCHGANQEGMVGPSLIANMKNLSKPCVTVAWKKACKALAPASKSWTTWTSSTPI
jgi:cytochrome c553